MNKEKLKNFGLSLTVFVLALSVMEGLFSCLFKFPNEYFTATPDSHFLWTIDTTYINGIHSDTSLVRFNSFGSRSGEIPETCHHKLMVLGGSTTACFALNQDKTWTYLLNELLGDSYWVGNFGRLGNNTSHHIYQTEKLLLRPELRDVKTAIFLVGINDFGGYLANEDKYLNQSSYETNLAAFAHVPDSTLPWFRKLTTFKMLKKAKQNLYQLSARESYGPVQDEFRKLYQKQKLEDVLPDLSNGTSKYRRNIKTLIDLCRNKGVTPIFVTQPTMWKGNLEAKYHRLLLGASRNNDSSPNKPTFFSTRALEEGMNSFNELLMLVCKEENVDCLDLASEMPKTTESFYDDCHFNESGAELVANKLYHFLRGKYLQTN